MDCMTLCVIEKDTKCPPIQDTKSVKPQESSNWTEENKFPKIRIEECGLTVHLKGYNKHNRKNRAKRLTLPPLVCNQESDDENGGKKEGLLGAKFCKFREDSKHYDRYDDHFLNHNNSNGYVDYMQIDRFKDRFGFRSLSHGFEPAPGSEGPIARLRYNYKDTEKDWKVPSDKDTDKIDVEKTKEIKRNRRNARENVVIRRLANKRSKPWRQYKPPRVSTSYGERPTKSTDIWVSNHGHEEKECEDGDEETNGIHSYPMPEFLRQLYETRDAFIETLRSRTGTDKLAANVRLAQEFTRDRYRPTFDRGLPQRLEQRRHNQDCPMCSNYMPTVHGHLCPPNTPFNKDRPPVRSRESKISSCASIPEIGGDKAEKQDLVLRHGPNHLASMIIHSL